MKIAEATPASGMDGSDVLDIQLEDATTEWVRIIDHINDPRESTVQWEHDDEIKGIGLQSIGMIPAYVPPNGSRRWVPDDVQDVLTSFTHTVVDFAESGYGKPPEAFFTESYDDDYEFSGMKKIPSAEIEQPVTYTKQRNKSKTSFPLYLTWLFERKGRAQIINYLLTTQPENEFSATGLARDAPFSADVALDYVDNLVDVGLLEKRLTGHGHGRYTFNEDSPVAEALLAANAVIANEYDSKRSVIE